LTANFDWYVCRYVWKTNIKYLQILSNYVILAVELNILNFVQDNWAISNVNSMYEIAYSIIKTDHKKENLQKNSD
jgi:hypothetical protein